MSKAVLISIQPKWCDLIASGKKTIEVRKTRPQLETPFKCYIYCTANKQGTTDLLEIHGANGKIRKANGKVIGEFICDKMIDIAFGIEEGVYFDGEFQEGFETNGSDNNPTCLLFVDLENYLTKNEGWGWHVSDFVIYEQPKALGEFNHCGANYHFNPPVNRPPQSWCYVEQLQEDT